LAPTVLLWSWPGHSSEERQLKSWSPVFIFLPELVHDGVPQEVFLALPFNEKVPQETIAFHEGFLANS
jgi:hypothetical protein